MGIQSMVVPGVRTDNGALVEPAEQAVDYSIVIPVYYNADCLEKLFNDLKNEILGRRAEKGELIFVDDGSGDNSFSMLRAFYEQNRDIARVIKLSRNFGQQFAVLAGLRNAHGRCVVSMSADGQEPPSLINEMLDKFFAGGVEIVAGRRQSREDSALRSLASRLAYGIMRKLAFPTMPSHGFDSTLLSRKALAVYFDNLDATPFGQGILLWIGFPIHYVDYARKERAAGSSRYTLGKLINYLMDGVIGFSFFPIRFLSFVGLIAAVCGFMYAAWLVVISFTGSTPVPGWSSIVVLTLVGGGLQMLMLGIIGEYMWRILANVRNRSPYVIESMLTKD